MRIHVISASRGSLAFDGCGTVRMALAYGAILMPVIMVACFKFK